MRGVPPRRLLLHHARPPLLLTGLLAALVLAASTGCSDVKLAYRFADTALERKLEPMVHSPAARKDVDRQVAGFMAWHRTRMLPRHAALLRRLADDNRARPMSRAALDRWWARLMGQVREVSGALAELAAMVLHRHNSPALRSHLRRHLAEEHKDLREQLTKPRGERIDAGTVRWVETFERFTGELKGPQRGAIRRHVTRMTRDPSGFLDNRRRRDTAVVAALKRGRSEAELKALMRRAFTRPQSFSPKAYGKSAERWLAQMRGLIHGTLASLDPQQRAALVQELHRTARDLDALAR